MFSEYLLRPRIWLAWAIVISAVAPCLAQDDGAGLLSNVRQVTFEGRRSGEGYFSADGTQFVFQSERNGENPFYQIYVLDLESGDVTRVSPGTGKTTCAWFHPTSSSKVLFASTHEDPDAAAKQIAELEERRTGRERRYSWDYDEWYDLYEVELGSRRYRNLTQTPGYNAEGSWSPDGEWIAFASNRHAYDQELTADEQTIFERDQSYFVDIYLMRADGSDVRRLTASPGYDGGPFFSPDGERIVWRRFAEDGSTAEIHTMRVDGTDQRQITSLGALSWAPFYHPSGAYLAFSTNMHGFGNFELYLVDVEGRADPVRVTTTEGFDGLPSFSPDGSTLAWTSTRASGGRSQIFFADWDHGAALRFLGVTETTATVETPERQTQPGISVDDLKTHAYFLASESMEGRMTGSEGERRAAEYLASQLALMGLQPAGDDGGYLQAFEFTFGVSVGADNALRFSVDGVVHDLNIDTNWRPLSFSATGAVGEAPVVFVGYGLVAPEEPPHAEYDSYVHLDVQDKWVLMLRGVPEDVSPDHRQHLSRYAALRYKVLHARERGAKGVLVASGPRSQAREQLVRLSFDASQGRTSLAAVSISDSAAQYILDGVGRSLASLQEGLDSGAPMMGFQIPNVLVEASIDVVRDRSTAHNVLARLTADHEKSSDPAVLVGAHYDHLGWGGGGTSLTTPANGNRIHLGADDNASGTAVVLEIAEELSALKASGALPMQRDVIFAFWSGEELGLLGSAHFAEHHDVDGNPADLRGEIAAALNLDMVGRLDDKLILQGIGSSSGWMAEVERANVSVGLPIVTQNDSYLPTDATSFYLKKVPILSAFTGLHSEYHTPRDAPDLLNYEGMEKIGRLMSRITRSLVGRSDLLDYQEMTRPEMMAGRGGMRAYLGTIPDYAQTDERGVKLSGVIDGGPAARAGVLGGDVIVELAGREIENIYDYTYAIDALKIGEVVRMVVLRSEQRVALEVLPESRD